LVKSSREFQKAEVRGALQSTPLSKSGELSQPLTFVSVSTTSLGPSYNMKSSAVVRKQREKQLGMATLYTLVTGINSSDLGLQNEQVQPSISFGQDRSNSLLMVPIARRVASTGSITDSVTPLNINSPSTETTHVPSLVAKVDQPVAIVSGSYTLGWWIQ